MSTITGINNNGLLEVLSRDGSLPFKQLTPYNREKKNIIVTEIMQYSY